MKFEHEGKIYATIDGEHCYSSANPSGQCAFFWRDGGIYDSCDFPDQELLQKTCHRDRRAEGINVIWIKLRPWMTLDHCPVCEHRQSQHDMNCIECCPESKTNAKRIEEPDKYCVTQGDGECISADPRCMHNIGSHVAEELRLKIEGY